MNFFNPHCTPGLNFYQYMMEKDHQSRIWNQERLRTLKRSYENQVEIFCSHDVVEFEKLSGRRANIPAEKIIKPPHPYTISAMDSVI